MFTTIQQAAESINAFGEISSDNKNQWPRNVHEWY